KILQHYPKCLEAMTILGHLYADEVFAMANQPVLPVAGQTGGAANAQSAKDMADATHRKAVNLLEAVRTAWKDTKRKLRPDTSVLFTLARLYEADHQDKALQCLQQAQQLEMDAI